MGIFWPGVCSAIIKGDSWVLAGGMRRTECRSAFWKMDAKFYTFKHYGPITQSYPSLEWFLIVHWRIESVKSEKQRPCNGTHMALNSEIQRVCCWLVELALPRSPVSIIWYRPMGGDPRRPWGGNGCRGYGYPWISMCGYQTWPSRGYIHGYFYLF